MDAMILAAGYGSRLASLGEPKPLVTVAGCAMIELSVRQAAMAGIAHFVVVTGHLAEPIERHLEQVAADVGVSVEFCRLDDWSRPNGYSVLAGAARIAGNYLLMMSDHLFNHTILDRMVAHMSLESGALLAIDRDVSGPRIDPEDATFVRLDPDGRITRIAKHIDPVDAVDCGVFVATPDLALAIEKAIEGGGSGSLSEGMQRLAAASQAGTIDVTGQWWIDVDDPHMHAMAQAEAPIHLARVLGVVRQRARHDW